MKELQINGGVVLLDDQDYEAVSRYRWLVRKNFNTSYAQRASGRKTILMHRVILGVGPGEPVDHRNGNGLDNRRENLRKCTNAQNQMNRRVTTLKRKGVTWHKKCGRWQAQIKVNGQNKPQPSLMTLPRKSILVILPRSTLDKRHDLAEPNPLWRLP